MEAGDKLKELNMTEEEVDRLTKAFKDENFRKMLQDYAEEISDPENKKKYEEEIKMLEQERGNSIEFVHPTPFKALRTSVDGKQKCYVNICANDKVGKPTSSRGVSEGGCRGQYWSLPHNLHPGRQFTDNKGNKFTVYDVVFHPDTLHIARRNRRFMEMVDNTAVQAIQKSFNVTLDGNNLKEMKTKYKGTPQPCVIRKPIPGYKPKEPSDKCDPLAFPYPDEKKPQHNRTPTKTGDTAQPIQIQPLKNTGPTQPKYTVKYRSYIDLQDFRCSRDSARSPRPKEIVVTIDLPLLKSVTEANLEVEEKRLLLESETPAYRLELPLAYSVDEEKGEAKFNKQKGQLTVTLPVLPSKETCPFAAGSPQMDVGDEEEVEVPSLLEEKEGEDLMCETQNDREAERKEEEDGIYHEEEEDVGDGDKSEGAEREQGVEDDPKHIQEDRVEVEEQKEETEIEKEQWVKEEDSLATDCGNADRDEEEVDCGTTSFQCDTSDRHPDASAEEISLGEDEFEITAQHEGHLGNREEDLDSCLTTSAVTRTETKGEEQEEEEERKVFETPVENDEVR